MTGWSVSIPLTELGELLKLPALLEEERKKTAQLEREVSALHGLYSEILGYLQTNKRGDTHGR